MFMHTEWLDEQFCTRCLRQTEHVKFSYGEECTITCQFCQTTTSVVEEVEEAVKKTFTVIAVDEQYNNPKRRMVKAEIRVESMPERFGDQNGKTEDIMVQYPAYEDQHFTAQVTPVIGKDFNFKDAAKISLAIKQFIGKE